MIETVSALFDKVFPDELKISAPRIQTLIESYHERERTGLIRLAYKADEQFHLLFKRGEMINSYAITPDCWESLSSEELTGRVKSTDEAYARLVPLSPLGLYICKLLIQNDAGNGNSEILPSNQISSHLMLASQPPKTSLVWLGWENASGAVLFSENEDDVRSLFYFPEGFQDEQGVSPAFQNWAEPNCNAITFAPDLSLDAWQEYYLHKSVTDICERTLVRIGTITGRAIVESLIRLATVFAARKNLDISIYSRRLMDREVFSSPQQAAETYRAMLKEMFEHFSAVIGSRLLASTLRDLILSLPKEEGEIVRKFTLFPDGYFYG